jgi:curved DNA-binding protein CbpA
MPQTSFSLEWLHQFSDPYAVLGLSLAADERRILKRYRTVAKLLHPDGQGMAEPQMRELASHLFARLVNPAYQKLKQEKERSETLAILRLHVRRMNRDEPLLPKSNGAYQLLKVPAPQVDVFYERTISELAEVQFQPVDQFESITQQLAELNLVYLYLKMGEPVIREKRAGIVAASQARPTQFAPTPAEPAQVATSYAQRHYQRAQEYAKKANWPQTVAELRDAIRLEADRSEYHSLLAKAYLMQNLTGMAKVHFRQALKFNPQDPLALQYAAKLGLIPDQSESKASSQPPGKSAPTKNSGHFFNPFARKR